MTSTVRISGVCVCHVRPYLQSRHVDGGDECVCKCVNVCGDGWTGAVDCWRADASIIRCRRAAVGFCSLCARSLTVSGQERRSGETLTINRKATNHTISQSPGTQLNLAMIRTTLIITIDRRGRPSTLTREQRNRTEEYNHHQRRRLRRQGRLRCGEQRRSLAR